MMDTSNATPSLFAALAVAQGEIENASKNSNNPHFKSKYADLAEVLNTVRPVFAKNGLGIVQSTEFDGSLVSVTTLVGHKEGGYITSRASCQPAKTDAQGVGSATTYLRRYSIAAMAGVAQEDDDGQSAAHNTRPAPVFAGRPTDGAWEAMDTETQGFLLKLAADVVSTMAGQGDAAAYMLIEGENLGSDEKAALWTRLDSKTRSALKRAADAAKRAADAAKGNK